jgi:hypothetical protein
MATKVSVVAFLAMLVTWLVFHQPIVDFAVLSLTTLSALSLLAWSAVKKSKKLFLFGAVPWIALGLFFHGAALQARIETGVVLEEMAATSSGCGDKNCISMKATGRPYSVAGTKGFLVESLGAAIYIKVFAEGGVCRAHEDELIGRARHVEWACPGVP